MRPGLAGAGSCHVTGARRPPRDKAAPRDRGLDGGSEGPENVVPTSIPFRAHPNVHEKADSIEKPPLTDCSTLLDCSKTWREIRRQQHEWTDGEMGVVLASPHPSKIDGGRREARTSRVGGDTREPTEMLK